MGKDCWPREGGARVKKAPSAAAGQRATTPGIIRKNNRTKQSSEAARRSFPSNFKDLLPSQLEITCGNVKGIWHSDRFKRGHKSKCIQYSGAWISPLRFIHMDKGSRDTLLDWKERIEYEGSSLKSLFVKVRQCKENCKCTLCFNSGSKTSPSPEASLLPPPPLRPASKDDSEVSSDSGLSIQTLHPVKEDCQETSSTSPSSNSSSSSSSAGRERLRDLNAAVQRALICMEGNEISQLQILLFILHTYDVESEDISLLNKRLRKSLEFLTRMDVLVKGGESDGGMSSESEGEERMVQDEVPAKVGPKKARKFKDPPPVKRTKKSKVNMKENKVRKPVIQKPKKLSPALSSLCGGVRKLSRHDVVRKVWVYIKKRNLQDSERKDIVKCDDKLRELSNEDEFHFRKLFRLLDSHMSDA